MDGPSAQVAAVFDRASDTYDDVGVAWFGPIAEALVAALAPGPGEAVLDVGCGKGAATFGLAERVGPAGRVVGLDLSTGMLAHARRIAEERGVATIEWRHDDAMAPDLPPASFDVLAASLVVFFLPDPGTALRAWRGLLREDGRLGLTTFGAFSPAIEALSALVDPYLPDESPDPRAPAEPDVFDSDAGVEGLLRQAGFAEAETRHVPVQVRLRDPEHWRDWSLSLGQRAAWERLPAGEQDRVLRRAREVFATWAGPDGSLVAVNDIRVTLARR